MSIEDQWVRDARAHRDRMLVNSLLQMSPMSNGTATLCGHCGRPIGSFNNEDRLVHVGGIAYHYKCTQPPKN